MKAGCPDPEQLRHFLATPALAGDEAGLARHVEGCPHCQALLEQLTAGEPTDTSSVNLAPDCGTDSDTFLRRLMKGGPTYRSLRGDLSFLRTPATAETEKPPLPVIPDYEIMGELGSGGMGIVYQARQVGLNRLVALKMLRTDADPQSLARFRAEAAAVARLQHPHIVQIHEIGMVEGRPFLCLEYVRGGTLAQKLAGSPVAPRPAAELAATLARAVHHAHEQGIVHRDLKPSNILIMPNGEYRMSDEQTDRSASVLRHSPFGIPKVTDFGLAKMLDVGDKLTASGDIMGTPDYMAPEQASGRQVLGPAVDIHALGVILYEMLTARLPYHGEMPLDTLLQVIHAEPVTPRRLQPGIPADLETVILKCLEKEPARRYLTALDLARDLEHFLAGEPIAARPPSAFYQWRKFARRNKALVGGVVATLLALLTGLIATVIFAMGESRQRQFSDENAQAAERARHAARREAYQARLMAALGLLQDHRAGEAAKQLEAAPQELRGWEWHLLHSRLDDSLERFPLLPGENQVTLAWGPDGWRAFTFQNGKVPTLRHLRSQEPLGTVDLENALHCVILPSRPGTQFLLEQNEGLLMLLDAQGQTGKQFTVSRHPYITAADLSPDGRLLALASHQYGPVTLLDAATGQILRTLPVDQHHHTRSLAFSPDGRALYSGHRDGSIRQWDVATWEVTPRVLQRHRFAVAALAFNPDGTRLASGGDDRLLCLWEVSTGRLLNMLQGHTGQVVAVAFSPDGQWIASGGREGAVRLWSAMDEEAAVVLKGHTAPVLRLLWHPDSTGLATATAQEVRLWGLAPGGSPSVLHHHRGSIYTAAYCANGRCFASGSWDSSVRLWDASSAVLASFPMPQWVASVALSPDGQTLAALGYNATLRVWDVPRRQVRATIEHRGFVGHDLMHTVAISPDGRTMAAPADRKLRRWDVATLQEKAALPLPVERNRLAVYSPDGKALAVVGADHVVYLVDADSGQVLQSLQGHDGFVQVVAFHPDGRRLLSAGRDRSMRVWDIKSGKLLLELHGHTGEVFAAAFHPNGTRLVTGGRDRVIRIWDVDTGEPLLWLEGHRGIIFSLAFSPDGHTLISAAGDQTIRIWDDFPVAQRLRALRKP